MLPWLPMAAFATGGWIPERWLDDGGRRLQGSPEFYWDLQMHELARRYAQKDLVAPFAAESLADGSLEGIAARTAKADIGEFEDALQTKRIQPPNVAAARAAHQAMREWLQKDAQGERPAVTEADSEFADYHQAAALYALKQYAAAKGAWEKLLQRPAAQRHYRTVWAAYMLGKCCLRDEAKREEAIVWFEKCRQFAREGFSDSLQLAADSIGWQARAELDCGKRAESARHYLQQLALGDKTAVVSLKLLVPDRAMAALIPLSFAKFPIDPNARDEIMANADEPSAAEKKAAQEALNGMLRDEVLRQIVTAHILATTASYAGSNDASVNERSQRWLLAIGQAKLDRIEGAAALAWVAYHGGNYADAEKWLKLDAPATQTGNWLRAKLAMRRGAFADAAGLMRGVVDGLPDDAAVRYEVGYLPKGSASADLGAALLAQGKFNESLEALLKGGCWEDAAYLAERVLTTDELVQFVKAHEPLSDAARKEMPDAEQDAIVAMRWEMKNRLMNLAGRRLIREDKPADGRLLLDEGKRETFDGFRELLATGNDAKKPTQERAKAFFDAACMLRENGSAWCGTEDDVQRVEWGGYAPEDKEKIVKSRQTGKASFDDWSDPDATGNPKHKVMANFIPSTANERKRLTSNRSASLPMQRYVNEASGLALRAAALLPDQSEELADVLNQAGRWIQDLDNPGADKIYAQLVKRAAKTKTGAAAVKKRWFIVPNGPWTSNESAQEQDSSSQGEPPLPEENRKGE